VDLISRGAGVTKEEHIEEVEQRGTPLAQTPHARRSSTRTLTVTPKSKVVSKEDDSSGAIPHLNTTGTNAGGSRGGDTNNPNEDGDSDGGGDAEGDDDEENTDDENAD
jgi:hypothetical protein